MDAATADPREMRLLNAFQRGFPLVAQPYDDVARALDADEAWVRERLGARLADGTVSRIGAVLAPGAIGASTLAALAVPPARLAAVAASVSAHREVNHNYEREHAYNLWFVVTAASTAALARVLDDIARETGLAPLALPLEREYWIDLGFDVTRDDVRGESRMRGSLAAAPLDDAQRALVAALASGLSLSTRPFADLARVAGQDEGRVLEQLRDWLRDGTIKRFGVVLRHRAFGFVANAMCVWDVPDADVDAVGETLGREPGVTLCYRRRRAPGWRYNLFAMLHGRDRAAVLARRAAIAARLALDRHPHAVLFSRRAFKQRGADHFAGDTSRAAIATPAAA